MKSWMWALLLGGVGTYFIHKTQPAYTWMAGGLTLIVVYFLFRRG